VVEDDRLVGIITNRDIRLLATRLPEPDRAGGGYTLSLETRVGEAMTREPILIEPDAELDEVLDLFIEAKVGAVPVVTGDRELVGIIGYIDLLSILRTKLDALLGRDDAVSQATHI
jgi:acetoin utilization protein AcuB